SASSAAQAAGVAALTDDAAEHVTSVIPLLRAERARLEEALTRLGIRTVPTATHFLLAGVGDASRIARLLRMEHGVAVRDCTSFGLPDHIRVAARTAGENDVLVAALEAVCSA
ncbi:MAG: aminotransferase class I/II-fold pyridoxal phosphate-dependent enzyme, partial [Gemmatimonadota bacterium]|nr:aminotransferase class I/II-fold pyridoxal phosphate-dependent enzyme [Gemmatimonadota bacterium]